MKVFFLFVFTTLFFSQNTEYQKLKQNHLIVTATKTIKVPCDLVEFSFSVSGTGSTLEEAVSKAKSKTSDIAKHLMNLGVSKKSLSTSNFHSGENYGDKAFLSSKRDYKAYISTKVSINDMVLAEKALIKISKLNPDNISQLNYKLENKDKHELNAIGKVTKKARMKAEQIAKTLGTQVNGVLFVEDQQTHFNNFAVRGGRSNHVRYKKMESMADAVEVQPSLFVQEYEIQAYVKIIFLLK